MRSIRVGTCTLILAVLMTAPAAHALQPLATFVDHAREANNDNRRAIATHAQRDAESNVALGHALPSLSARGIFARSQLNPSLPGADGAPSPPLVPQNIWFVSAGISIPINVGSWERTAAAKAIARSAESAERATALTVEQTVTRDYYELVGTEAVLRSAQHGLALSTKNAATVRARAVEGEASVLDVERSRADVARAEQDLADAEGNLLHARRTLASAAGLEPEPAAESAFFVDDLHEEAPASQWMGNNLDARPAVAQAVATREAAHKSLDAARVDWLPTIAGTAQENYTNATENLGRKDFYSLLATASWQLDLAHGPSVSAEHAALDAARASESQARIDAQDAVYFAWVQVRTDIRKARAARAQEMASAHAAELAVQSFAAGEATQIDVLQAQQTAIQAEVARVRVESDLAYARAALRLSVSDGARR